MLRKVFYEDLNKNKYKFEIPIYQRPFADELIKGIKEREIQYDLISENILDNLYEIVKWKNENKIIDLSKVYFVLISNHLNSSLIDKNFQEKRSIIANQLNRGTIESLKMLLVYSKYENWTPNECKKHYEDMFKLLKESLKN